MLVMQSICQHQRVHNLLRRLCMRSITTVYFEGCVLLLVLMSSVLLALDTPSLDDYSRLGQVIAVCNIIFTACFALEMCMKVSHIRSNAFSHMHQTTPRQVILELQGIQVRPMQLL